MTSTSADLKPADIQKSIAAGNFVDALRDIDRLLTIDPDNTEVLYMAQPTTDTASDEAPAGSATGTGSG